MIKTEFRYLGFGKNKYGGGNDLNGCVNDVINRSKKLTGLWNGIDCRAYTDYQVTASNYLSKGAEAISLLDPGATVVVPMDSCFAGTATRLSGNPYKNRFIDPKLPYRPIVRTKVFTSDNIMWIAMSGCGEQQTCADANINGDYVGAYSFFGDFVMRKGMTYREWHEEIRKRLPNNDFYQIPEIEGPEELLNRRLFEGQTLWIHNSSHGSWTYDKDGDEADGKDEGFYFDRLLIDDETRKLLSMIPTYN